MPQPDPSRPAQPLLSVDDLAVRFETPRGTVHAVDGVSLHVARCETLGIVGESGCGKSTLARAIVSLIAPSSGGIALEGEAVAQRSRAALRRLRRDVQMVFQDPSASLDPRWSAGDLVAEPLHIHGVGSRAERRARVADLFARVGLHAGMANRYPHEFSGGQRQRLGIARALALEPRLLILDEPVSALDVSVQAQILNLLVDLQKALSIGFLFISHDLSVVEYISHRVAVMYLGRIVETATRADLWRLPAHPYTQALLAAVPHMEERPGSTAVALVSGELPSPYAPPPGCRFHPRCPFALDRCRTETPALRPFGGQDQLGDHQVACHRAEELVPRHAGH